MANLLTLQHIHIGVCICIYIYIYTHVVGSISGPQFWPFVGSISRPHFPILFLLVEKFLMFEKRASNKHFENKALGSISGPHGAQKP